METERGGLRRSGYETKRRAAVLYRSSAIWGAAAETAALRQLWPQLRIAEKERQLTIFSVNFFSFINRIAA